MLYGLCRVAMGSWRVPTLGLGLLHFERGSWVDWRHSAEDVHTGEILKLQKHEENSSDGRERTGSGT